MLNVVKEVETLMPTNSAQLSISELMPINVTQSIKEMKKDTTEGNSY